MKGWGVLTFVPYDKSVNPVLTTMRETVVYLAPEWISGLSILLNHMLQFYIMLL